MLLLQANASRVDEGAFSRSMSVVEQDQRQWRCSEIRVVKPEKMSLL